MQAGPRPTRRGGTARRSTSTRTSTAAALKFIDPELVRGHAPRLKVVVDGGNGMAGPMVGPLLEQLGLELVETYWTPDGNFPDHEPNPLLPENRELIIERVRASGADLGIAWDGDADRCFFIDEHGAVRRRRLSDRAARRVTARTARQRGPSRSSTTCAPRAPSRTPLSRAGGPAHINRVGHAFFKTRMREEGSLFGGEVSGHYYFRDFYCADSGTLPALLMLELLSPARAADVGAAGALPRRVLHLRRDQLARSPTRPAKMDEIAAALCRRAITHLDGVSIDYPDWHFNVRPSNTEPLLRLCLESLVSPQDMVERRDEVLALIRS